MPPRDSSTGGVAQGDWSTVSDSQYTTSTRSMPWFRLYTSLTHDMRFRRQPLYIRWAWIAILSIAGRCSKRGYLIIDGENMTAADLADEAAITTEQASEAMEWFQSRLLIVSYRGSLRVDGWERSQFGSDSSTERVQKHRSECGNVKRSKPVTRNGFVTPPDNRVQSTNTKPKSIVGKPDLAPVSEVIDHLNQRVGSNFKNTTKATRQKIQARFNEGFTLDDFKRVIDTKAAAWLGNPEMSPYLRPDTLFSTKFEGYLNESIVRASRKPTRALRAPCPNPDCINGMVYDRDRDEAKPCPACH